MDTTTIRVTIETRDRLNALARVRGATASEVVAELVSAADDRALLADAERSWALLAADPERFASYVDETRELEQFEPEPPPY